METGICLLDVSLYKDLCEILGVILNEFFVDENKTKENFKEVVGKNLLNALENRTLTLKDGVDFYRKEMVKKSYFRINNFNVNNCIFHYLWFYKR